METKRLKFAFDQLDSSDGQLFERFANSFLAIEYIALRPVGGMHDEGADAFLHSDEDSPDVFVQHSVQKDWKSKIRKTAKRLIDAGKNPRVLIFCTPRHAISDCADVRKALQREHKIHLDVRDVEWFLATVNSSPALVRVAEEFCRQKVDPLLARDEIVPPGETFVASGDEAAVAAYLQLMAQSRDPHAALTKLCVDAVTIFALRDTSSDNRLKLADIGRRVRMIMTSDAHVNDRVAAALERFRERGQVKHHATDGSWCLSHEYAQAIKLKFAEMASEEAAYLNELRMTLRSSAELLQLPPIDITEETARALLGVCDTYLFKQGKKAASALAKHRGYEPSRETMARHVDSLLTTPPDWMRSVTTNQSEDMRDLLVEAGESVLRSPPPNVRRRLARSVDAFCLLFMMREVPDVQKAINALLGDVTVVLDASMIIPFIIERLYPVDQRPVTDMLRTARSYGIKLVTCSWFVNEVVSHLQNAIKTYNNYKVMQYRDHVQEIVAVYLSTSGLDKGFTEFVRDIIGTSNPGQDLVEFLKHEYEIEHHEFVEDKADDEHVERERLMAEWSALGAISKRKGISEDKSNLLAAHDVDAIMAIRRARRRDKNATLGYRWWWLTLDGRAFRLDKSLSNEPASVCMSPEYFVRYLSIRPKTSSTEVAMMESLPLTIEASRLELLSAEFTRTAQAALAEMQDAPAYLRRRKIRDLLNEAREAGQSEFV